MDANHTREQEMLEQMKQQQFLDHVKELQSKGQQVVLVVGERQEISKLIERLGKNTEVVTPMELADKVFDIKASNPVPELQQLPPRDREYWKGKHQRAFGK
jgi:uncharacterized protein (DUF1015 family)